MPAPSYNSFFSPLQTRQIPREHPRLFGSRARLQQLARERPDAWRRTKAIAATPLTPGVDQGDTSVDFGAQVSVHCKMWSLALVAAVDEDRAAAREAIGMAFTHFIDRPVQVGHVTFGGDVGECAMVYDLCHEHWTSAERQRFVDYLFECRDKNVDEEPSPFHDGWWGYKNWGLVLGMLAVMYETGEREPFMLQGIDREFRLNAAECLRLAGDGGGYSEGYYVNYYIYEWLLACEAMRHCTGADWYLEVPEFYKNRAVTMMFEHWPTLRERGSRRSICVGDGRGRFFKVERDKQLAAMRILVDRFRDDADHQAVAAHLATTPRMGADENAYREVLFGDPTVAKGDLARFRRSHVSPGPGFAYARSDWTEAATHLFFKCGKRVTSHQHLDVGHFFIFRHEELAGEGGHYCDFGGAEGTHDANYYMRSIAHNTVLVHDPSETWSYIRAAAGTLANDGGQRYPWPNTAFRHNGDAGDADTWRRHPELGDVGRLTAFSDAGAWVYMAGDATKAYAASKLKLFTRQIVFLRPGTIVILDRVTSTRPEFRKSWVLHAAKPPTRLGEDLVVTHGTGRLFVQTVLPLEAQTRLNQGDDLYRVGDRAYPPRQKYGPECECRIEISPTTPATAEVFLHVLTATEADVASVPRASVAVDGARIALTIGDAELVLHADRDGGMIRVGAQKGELGAGLPTTRR